MMTLTSTRRIRAPREVCYDLVRSIDVHQELGWRIQARAEDGKTSGLPGLGDRMLWSARYLGIRIRFWLVVDCCDWPVLYGERNLGGPLRTFQHSYRFLADGEFTLISDRLEVEFPFGPVGQWVGKALFGRTLATQLEHRMDGIKTLAEEHAREATAQRPAAASGVPAGAVP